MADFLTAYKITARNEGGYVDDPVDPGGETYAGITRKNFPNWPGWQIVDAHKPLKHGAIIPELFGPTEDFYRENFWNAVKGDSISDQALANKVFDISVNMGISEALTLLNLSA